VSPKPVARRAVPRPKSIEGRSAGISGVVAPKPAAGTSERLSESHHGAWYIGSARDAGGPVYKRRGAHNLLMQLSAIDARPAVVCSSEGNQRVRASREWRCRSMRIHGPGVRPWHDAPRQKRDRIVHGRSLESRADGCREDYDEAAAAPLRRRRKKTVRRLVPRTTIPTMRCRATHRPR